MLGLGLDSVGCAFSEAFVGIAAVGIGSVGIGTCTPSSCLASTTTVGECQQRVRYYFAVRSEQRPVSSIVNVHNSALYRKID